jgi:hypothetical protein
MADQCAFEHFRCRKLNGVNVSGQPATGKSIARFENACRTGTTVVPPESAYFATQRPDCGEPIFAISDCDGLVVKRFRHEH